MAKKRFGPEQVVTKAAADRRAHGRRQELAAGGSGSRYHGRHLPPLV